MIIEGYVSVGKQQLEHKDWVRELANGIRKRVLEIVKVLLHSSNHRRGTADEDLAVRLSGVLEVGLDVLLGDEADTARPAGRGVVEDVVNLELLGVRGLEVLELLVQEDVGLVDVGVEERHGGLVLRVPEDGTDDLDHWGNTGTSSNHAEVIDEVGGVLEVALGSLDAELVARVEGGDIARDVALFVGLDEELKVALVVGERDGGVVANDGLAVDLCCDSNVLADGKAEDIVRTGKLEAVARMQLDFCVCAGERNGQRRTWRCWERSSWCEPRGTLSTRWDRGEAWPGLVGGQQTLGS